MKNMSFALTEPQLMDGSKDVTRRLGWTQLKAGDQVQAVRKAMGLKPGEKVQPLAVLEVLSVRRERLDAITPEDVLREGFPGMSPERFVMMFCGHHKGASPGSPITRIEFRNPNRKDSP